MVPPSSKKKKNILKEKSKFFYYGLGYGHDTPGTYRTRERVHPLPKPQTHRQENPHRRNTPLSKHHKPTAKKNPKEPKHTQIIPHNDSLFSESRLVVSSQFFCFFFLFCLSVICISSSLAFHFSFFYLFEFWVAGSHFHRLTHM